jgi:hypothetical protein
VIAASIDQGWRKKQRTLLLLLLLLLLRLALVKPLCVSPARPETEHTRAEESALSQLHAGCRKAHADAVAAPFHTPKTSRHSGPLRPTPAVASPHPFATTAPHQHSQQHSKQLLTVHACTCACQPTHAFDVACRDGTRAGWPLLLRYRSPELPHTPHGHGHCLHFAHSQQSWDDVEAMHPMHMADMNTPTLRTTHAPQKSARRAPKLRAAAASCCCWRPHSVGIRSSRFT